jgi:hypothetical protein
MAKYSTFKYGAKRYGVIEPDADLAWTFIVKWDGRYWSPNEGLRMVDLVVERGRRHMLDKNGLVDFPPGRAYAIFDNEDGRYDAFNTESPLYPNISPGKFVRIAVQDQDTENNKEVMRGTIEDIQPILRNGKQCVRITVVDGLKWLQDQVIHVGLNSTLSRRDCVSRIINASNWPTEEWTSDIGTDATIQDYYWAWNQNAYGALSEFNNARQAVAWCSNQGWFIWKPFGWDHQSTMDLDETEILRDIGRPQPWEVVRNIIRISNAPKVLDPVNTTLWELQNTPALVDGEEFYIECLFKYAEWQPCGASVSFTHTVNTQADGAGVDLTAACPLTYNTQIGEGAQITITNSSGSDGYITLLKATGDAIYPPDIDLREVEDSASQTSYGPQVLEINSRWVEDTVEADTLANTLLAGLKDPTMYPIVHVENRFLKQFDIDLVDQVVLRVPTQGINGAYRIGYIKHQWLNEKGQSVRTTFHLEPYSIGGEEVAYRGCQAYLTTADQSIASASEEDIAFNAELFDTHAYHDNSTNPNRFTCPTGGDGYYHVTAQVYWDNADTDGVRIVYVRVNAGATALAQASDDAQPTDFIQHVSCTLYLDAGDYVTIGVYQNSGSALDVQKGQDSTSCTLDYIGA